jgi:uncharacterized protein (TIGR03437 family)
VTSKVLFFRICLFLSVPPLFCDSSSIIMGAGYRNPIPLRLAPGQVVTIFVAGVGHLDKSLSATGLPLPASLGGISVLMTQSYGPKGPISVPSMAVAPFNTCLNPGTFGTLPCAKGAAITVQIPFELVPNIPGQQGPPNGAQLTASDGISTSAAIDVNPLPDQLHALNGADTLILNGSGPEVTHADGTLVTPAKPGTAGEELVMYLVGLGPTNPAVPTGTATPPIPPITTNKFLMGFDFRPNAGPMRPVPESTAVAPIFAGLTPGNVGLYQVNFVVPSIPTGSATCTDTGSNLTVTVAGPTSFDGAAICVATRH